MYETQSDIPIPRTARTYSTPRPRKYPYETMDVGTMFFVPNRTKNTLSTHTSAVGKKLGKVFVTRLVWARRDEKRQRWDLCEEDTPGAVRGVAVWRKE